MSKTTPSKEFTDLVKYLNRQEKTFLIGLIMGFSSGSFQDLKQVIKYFEKQIRDKK